MLQQDSHILLDTIHMQTHQHADELLLQTSMSHMVHVVSMLDVPSLFGSVSFQSKDVRGAQNSLFLFCTSTKLVSNYFLFVHTNMLRLRYTCQQGLHGYQDTCTSF